MVRHLHQHSQSYQYRSIYADLLASPCVRLLNATGAVGCSAPATGGILYPVGNDAEFKELLSSSTLSDTYMAVLPLELVTRSNIAAARASGKVSGFVVTESKARDGIVSHDRACPDCGHAAVKGDWNPRGTGLALDDLTGFPMFALFNSTPEMQRSLASVVSAAEQNRQRKFATPPLLAAELDGFMSGVDTAGDCLRRGMCKPMGGQSVYASYSKDWKDDRAVVLMTATLDGKALFHDLAQGAMGNLAGVAAQLTAAAALAPLDVAKWRRHIAFALFTGEAWGHIGSRAFVRDLAEYKCTRPHTEPTAGCPYYKAACAAPCVQDDTFATAGLTPNKVSHVIDANWLGGAAPGTAPLALRVYSAGAGTLAGVNATAAFGANVTLADPARGLPPSPALAFLDRNPAVRAVSLTTADGAYPAEYATEYDDAVAAVNRTDTAATVCAAAQVLARAAANLASDGAAPVPVANCTLAASLLRCLTGAGAGADACPLGLRFQSNARVSSYASVAVYGAQPGWPARVAATFLANATAYTRGNACNATVPCTEAGASCVGGTCLVSNTHYHLAFPTGLKADPETGRWSVVPGTSEPAWTESDWDRTALRIYAVAPAGVQVAELLVGIAVVAVTAAAAWVARKKVKLE
ncbi:hypothetical protein H9P43_004962 [Blastocladiella emersonii ATCC 22665]|nr:hypothetical protein H9P43_004962 [Blastocladiella emersonii ATCC 22665]